MDCKIDVREERSQTEPPKMDRKRKQRRTATEEAVLHPVKTSESCSDDAKQWGTLLAPWMFTIPGLPRGLPEAPKEAPNVKNIQLGCMFS